MIPGSGEKGHGKGQEVSIGDVHEAVFYRGSVPGILGRFTVEFGVCLPEMRLPPRIPAGQRTVSMRQVPSPGFSNSGDGAP